MSSSPTRRALSDGPASLIGATVMILPGIFLIGKASHGSELAFVFALASNCSCAAQKYFPVRGREQ